MTPRNAAMALATAATAACMFATAGAGLPRPAALRASVDNGAARLRGETATVTTISPNADGFRDRARIRIRLASTTKVRFEVRRGLPEPKTVEDRVVVLHRGLQTIVWAPPADTAPGSYRVVLTAAGRRSILLVRVEGVDAGFARASYAPGARAVLRVRTDARVCSIRFFRVGAETGRLRSPSELRGVPASGAQRLDPCGAPGLTVSHALTVGRWPSGFYFARIDAADGRTGFAPLIVRPRHLGEHRIAVVEPTFTWQAYNFRDDDADGVGDTWYANWSQHTARIDRPFLDRGVPPHFRWYDLQFLHWLARHDQSVDLLSDEDLDEARSAELDAYDLIVFPGHHEYVTTHEYDAVERFRDGGGHLMFLSANNFFWRVERHGSTLRRVAQWRDLGRPEAGLVGVQYRGNDDGGRRGPYVVADAPAWLLPGTGLERGSTFGRYGIEIDQRTAASPSGTRVLARIPQLYGQGFDAEMTYYETPAGARVFAAGAFTLAGTAQRPEIDALLANLWRRLAHRG